MSENMSMREIEKENKRLKKEELKKAKKEARERKRETGGSGKTIGTGAMKLLQHFLIALCAVAAILLISKSVVVVNRYNGREIHTQFGSDAGRKYEDSVLFNTIFGYEARDILKLVTIRSQMETGGVYDPDRIIDIVQYNARQSETYTPGKQITARYYLGDLLKWRKYGFHTETVHSDLMAASANALLYGDDGTGDMSGFYNDHYDDLLYDSYFDTGYDYSYEASGDTESGDTADEELNSAFSKEIVINRYKSTDGKNLQDYASNWEEYDELANALFECADDLYTNYMDYLKMQEYFDSLNSNIRYCVTMGEGDDREVYTNVGEINAIMQDQTIAKLFEGYGRYLRYDSDRMMYVTNTAVTESTFNTLIQKYKYAYSDDSKIYIAVDMTMPVNDAVRSASRNYTSIIPNRNELILAMTVCILLYLILLVICTIHEGRTVDADGNVYIKFSGFDHTPIELWILIVSLILFFMYVTAALVYTGLDSEKIYSIMEFKDSPYTYAVCGILVFILDIVILGLYYSLVRRIKGRHIWKQSFLYKLIRAIGKIAYSIYDNGNTLLRSVVPFAGLGIINLFLVAMAASGILPVLDILSIIIIDILACVFVFKQTRDRENIIGGMKRIISGDLAYKSDTSRVHGDNRELSECVNSISDSVRSAVEQSMKDERMKTELVANVSHDIRTPLTSIINYVDLIKRENIDNETVRGYVEILDEKSQRLKTLTDDLIEASKVSSGNVELELVKMNLPEMVTQALGEFDEKLSERNLSVVVRSDRLVRSEMMADGRSLWRVMENLFGNVCKYAMPGTRVFVDMFNATGTTEKIVLRITNMSDTPLPADLSELTERFIRGDESRTTEGSGLGLSIAKTLTELMGGSFEIGSEADLFKAEIAFDVV
ncbi:MAG: HAMP domain-containing histidine kinase [Lachnospiraceae bacterium]|nr:HAMP domain-containing histidine kinase [Lachnospiraceae bacterium]